MKALRANETLRDCAAPLASKTLFSKPRRLAKHDFHDFFDFGHLVHPRLAAIPDVDLGLQVRYRPELSPNNPEYFGVCQRNMRSENEFTDLEKIEKNPTK